MFSKSRNEGQVTIKVSWVAPDVLVAAMEEMALGGVGYCVFRSELSRLTSLQPDVQSLLADSRMGQVGVHWQKPQ